MYRIIVYPEADDQIAELPAADLEDYAAILDAVELALWNGAPQHKSNPARSPHRPRGSCRARIEPRGHWCAPCWTRR